nr:MAG TPA: hypothetical protein [Bacteriophage sp.]
MVIIVLSFVISAVSIPVVSTSLTVILSYFFDTPTLKLETSSALARLLSLINSPSAVGISEPVLPINVIPVSSRIKPAPAVDAIPLLLIFNWPSASLPTFNYLCNV